MGNASPTSYHMGLICLAHPDAKPKAAPKGPTAPSRRWRLRGTRTTHRVQPAPPPPDQQIWIMLGADAAGKSTLAHGLHGRTLDEYNATTGFNNIISQRRNQQLRLFDVGGGQNIRAIWPEYFSDVHGAVFMVDAADADRFAEARELLHKAYSHKCMSGKPLLVVANKQTLPQAVGPDEIKEALRLHELAGNSWHLVGSDTTQSAEGIEEAETLQQGLDWLTQRIKLEWDAIQARRECDKAEQAEADRKRKEERRARIEARRREREAAEAAAVAEVPKDEPAAGVSAPSVAASVETTTSATQAAKPPQSPRSVAISKPEAFTKAIVTPENVTKAISVGLPADLAVPPKVCDNNYSPFYVSKPPTSPVYFSQAVRKETQLIPIATVSPTMCISKAAA